MTFVTEGNSMSGLSEAAADARARADVSLDPGHHAVANALEGALDAAAREQLAEMAPQPDTEGIPDPPVSSILIPRPGRERRWRRGPGDSSGRAQTGASQAATAAPADDE